MIWASVLFFLLTGSSGWAQVAVTPKTPLALEQKKLGWIPAAKLGVNLSLSSSENVVGQTDGNSQTYGFSFQGSINHNLKQSQWRNSLSIDESTTSTPSVPSFVKSGDDLHFTTLYLHSIPSAPRFGPYAKGELQTSLFKGEDVRAASQNYDIHHLNGTAETQTGTSLHLTDPLKPLTTKESAGLFWKAIEKKTADLEIRLGLGAMQVNAGHQYALKGTEANGSVEVDELSDIRQLGLESGVALKGDITKTSSYQFGTEILLPFISNKAGSDSRNALSLTNVDTFFKLSSQITSWASFSYDYKLKIQPQLIDRAQQIHLLVLNINYNLL